MGLVPLVWLFCDSTLWGHRTKLECPKCTTKITTIATAEITITVSSSSSSSRVVNKKLGATTRKTILDSFTNIHHHQTYQHGEIGVFSHSHHLVNPQPPSPPLPQSPPIELYGQLEKQGSFQEEMSKKMGDTHRHQQQQKQKPSPISSRLALRNAAAGEIVEVQGGHIVRSMGRKDRHSKVCTAKGPRDRRVRLSAHTAIQFYDVQDRLGYDRPSKVVDWLMKKAKPAIDVLAELPAWKPTATTVIKNMKEEQESEKGKINGIDDDDGEGTYIGRQDQNQQQQNHRICNNGDNNTGLLPPSLDSNAIVDTIKSFFPTGGNTTHGEEVSATSSPPVQPIQFANYPSEFMSRSRSHSQDLRLSLQQSLHPMMMHQHHHQTAQQHPFLSGAATSQHQHLVGFDHVHDHDHDHSAAGWAENQPTDMTRCQRLVTGWNTDGFMFNPPPPASQLLQPFFGQLFSQREPLQSSNNHNTTTNNPLFRAWISDSSISNATTDDQNHQMSSMHPHSMAAIGFASGGFSGFHIPARIQDDEEHDGNPNKLSASLH